MSWDDRGNSVEAWESAYAPGGHWDQINGDELTTAFCRVLLSNLPSEVAEWLAEPGRTVLDWGCARGQMVEGFREALPNAKVWGLDFSKWAIRQARAKYGGGFICANRTRTRWDCIVVSNVHEHVVDYIGLVHEHLKFCDGRYIILTPFNESLGQGEEMTPAEREQAGHAHVQKFGLDSFPVELDGWVRESQQIVEPGSIWPGQQLLIIYGGKK